MEIWTKKYESESDNDSVIAIYKISDLSTQIKSIKSVFEYFFFVSLFDILINCKKLQVLYCQTIWTWL